MPTVHDDLPRGYQFGWGRFHYHTIPSPTRPDVHYITGSIRPEILTALRVELAKIGVYGGQGDEA